MHVRDYPVLCIATKEAFPSQGEVDHTRLPNEWSAGDGLDVADANTTTVIGGAVPISGVCGCCHAGV
jgi:hypothetical protein